MLNISPVIAHRGASALAPENTMAAFSLASDMGSGWVELDVRRCGSGELVVFHDRTLSRCGALPDAIAHLTLKQLQQVDVGSWFGRAFRGERIPLFEEAMQHLLRWGVGVNVELKAPRTHQYAYCQSVVQVLARLTCKVPARLLLSSSSYAVLRIMQHLTQGLPLAWIYREDKAALTRLADPALAVIVLHEKKAQPVLLAKLKGHHKKVVAYTVNDPARARALLALGVDAVFSDDPCLLARDDCLTRR